MKPSGSFSPTVDRLTLYAFLTVALFAFLVLETVGGSPR